jgi:hypothetical protein
MTSIEVLQGKLRVLEGFNNDKPGYLIFNLKGCTTTVEFYSEEGKSRELCSVNFDTLKSSTDQAVKNIFYYLEQGILKIHNEK